MRSAAMKLSLLLAMLACGARLSVATRLNNAPCTTYMDCPMQLPCGRSGNCFIMDRWGDNPVGAMASTPMVTPTPIIPTTPVSVPAATPATTSTTPTTGTGSPATTTAAQFVTTGTSTSGGSSTPATGGGSTTTTTPNLVSSDAQGFGDPQFIGLDGRMFFFDGLPHKYFNLVSEENHQLNALFVPGPHKISALGEESDGTFLGEFGLKAYGTVVTVKVDEQGYMSAIVNGEKMGHDELATHQFSRTVEGDKKVTVVVEEYRENLGQAVTVITPLLEFIFFPTVRHWDPEFNQTTRGHLNLALSLEMDDIRAGSLHGVLGQTTPDRAPVAATLPDELQTLFLGEGKPEDYQVSSLLADDFKYNQYRGGEQTRRSNTAWREADNQTA